MNDFLHYLPFIGRICLRLLLIFFILRIIFSSTIKSLHSHWNTLIDDFNFSTLEFYKLLKVELESHGVKSVVIKNVSLKQGNMFSSKRTYLRATWRDYQYDICGAPFGKGFFISWWLLYKNSFGQILISKIPFIGSWLVKKLYTITYYKIDTASMFMTYAQSSVLKVIENITKSKGIRSLSLSEQKPIMQDIFKR